MQHRGSAAAVAADLQCGAAVGVVPADASARFRIDKRIPKFHLGLARGRELAPEAAQAADVEPGGERSAHIPHAAAGETATAEVRELGVGPPAAGGVAQRPANAHIEALGPSSGEHDEIPSIGGAYANDE